MASLPNGHKRKQNQRIVRIGIISFAGEYSLSMTRQSVWVSRFRFVKFLVNYNIRLDLLCALCRIWHSNPIYLGGLVRKGILESLKFCAGSDRIAGRERMNRQNLVTQPRGNGQLSGRPQSRLAGRRHHVSDFYLRCTETQKTMRPLWPSPLLVVMERSGGGHGIPRPGFMQTARSPR